jgi:hypothetical protein
MKITERAQQPRDLPQLQNKTSFKKMTRISRFRMEVSSLNKLRNISSAISMIELFDIS